MLCWNLSIRANKSRVLYQISRMAYRSVCLQIQDSSVVVQVSDITGMFLSNFPKKVWGHGDCRRNWRIWLILQALPMHQYTEILFWLYIFSAILGFYHQLDFMVVWVLGKEQRAMQIWSPPMLLAVTGEVGLEKGGHPTPPGQSQSSDWA